MTRLPCARAAAAATQRSDVFTAALVAGRTAALHQSRWNSKTGRECIESGWWDGQDISRDYFVARNRQGMRLWVFRNRREVRRARLVHPRLFRLIRSRRCRTATCMRLRRTALPFQFQLPARRLAAGRTGRACRATAVTRRSRSPMNARWRASCGPTLRRATIRTASSSSAPNSGSTTACAACCSPRRGGATGNSAA